MAAQSPTMEERPRERSIIPGRLVWPIPKPAVMNPKLFGAVLKEELQRVTTVDANGDNDSRKEADFRQKYLDWIFASSPAVNFQLQLSDIIDEVGLLRQLGSTGGNAFTVAVFNRLPDCLQQRIRAGETSDAIVKDTVQELNRLIQAPEPPMSKAIEERFDAEHKEIFGRYGPKLPQPALNRLYLQAAFPDFIGKAWENPRAIYAWIHAHREEVELNALCLSGGGIRSATFALGILQGLAKHGLLPRFQYLSTVSGGGYIGSWLQAWVYRQGFTTVQSVLSGSSAPAAAPRAGKDPLKPEAEEVRHLRDYSNYLSPKLGLLSADTWTLAGTYLRNLLLNWCVFLPALALVLLLPRWCVAVCLYPAQDWLIYTALGLGAVSLLTALVYTALHRPTMGVKLAAEAGQGKFLALCLGPLYGAAVCFASAWAWIQIQKEPSSLQQAVFPNLWDPQEPVPWLPFLLLGAGAHLVAWLIYSLVPLLRKDYVRTRGSVSEWLPCLLSGAAGGLLLWVGARLGQHRVALEPDPERFVCFGAPWFLGSFLLALFLFVGLTSRATDDEDREWWGRLSAWNLIVIGAWLVFSVVVLFGPDWLLRLPRLLMAAGGITGLVTLILTHSGATPANKKEAAEGKPVKGTLSNLALGLAAPVFIVIFVAALSLGTSWLATHTPTVLPFHAKASNPTPDPRARTNFFGAARLSAGAIRDFPGLAARLDAHLDAPALEVWQALSPGLQKQLSAYANTGTRPQETLANLVRELNGMLTRPPSYSGPPAMEPSATPGTDRLTRELAQARLARLQQAFSAELDQSHFDPRMITHKTSLLSLLYLTLALLLGSLLLSLMINVNRFSLHAVYRNRLIRAYLGASNRARHPNAFTGFDPRDNVAMAELKSKPFPIVNMALNLVGGSNLAWQQRKAESFTASPLHAGCHRLGYRSTAEYASGRHRLRIMKTLMAPPRGLTLGTAITISGAAASPNMGYHSSSVLAFVMTLFNVRLGAWLGNPGKCGSESYKDAAPKLAFWHLARESFGLTDDQDEYVYLSDGGHFENLGLYEMVLRRCRFIVVSDAGCDPDCALQDLGNAIRKIRIDLGIPITIDQFAITRRALEGSKYCALGTIDYSAVDGELAPPGKLLYIKPAIAGDEPKDVFNYKETSKEFPHEPTSNQWFSESQFESYRALGSHIITTLAKGDGTAWNPPQGSNPLEYFFLQAEAYLNKLPSKSARNTATAVLNVPLTETDPKISI